MCLLLFTLDISYDWDVLECLVYAGTQVCIECECTIADVVLYHQKTLGSVAFYLLFWNFTNFFSLLRFSRLFLMRSMRICSYVSNLRFLLYCSESFELGAGRPCFPLTDIFSSCTHPKPETNEQNYYLWTHILFEFSFIVRGCFLSREFDVGAHCCYGVCLLMRHIRALFSLAAFVLVNLLCMCSSFLLSFVNAHVWCFWFFWLLSTLETNEWTFGILFESPRERGHKIKTET